MQMDKKGGKTATNQRKDRSRSRSDREDKRSSHATKSSTTTSGDFERGRAQPDASKSQAGQSSQPQVVKTPAVVSTPKQVETEANSALGQGQTTGDGAPASILGGKETCSECAPFGAHIGLPAGGHAHNPG